MPVAQRSGRRLAWLSANIVLNVLAASVIVYFEDTLTRLIALAAFLPIISDMSGCSGNQAVAVSMRELSLGLVRPREVLRVWGKEVSVGLINGVSLGVLLGLVAWLWRGNPTLGIVVGVALALNTIVAVSIGGSVPLDPQRPGRRSGPGVGSNSHHRYRYLWVLLCARFGGVSAFPWLSLRDLSGASRWYRSPAF